LARFPADFGKVPDFGKYYFLEEFGLWIEEAFLPAADAGK
jgi:hypothetical protein